MKEELYKVVKSLKELGLRDERIIEMVRDILTPGKKGGNDVNHK